MSGILLHREEREEDDHQQRSPQDRPVILPHLTRIKNEITSAVEKEPEELVAPLETRANQENQRNDREEELTDTHISDDLDHELGKEENEEVELALETLLHNQQPIGEGSIAKAYRVEVPGVGPVIVKVGKTGDEEYFQRSRQALELLKDQPGIPERIETKIDGKDVPFEVYRERPGTKEILKGLHHGEAILSQEFLELDMEQKETFVEALAEILSNIHQQGLIHNDLGLDHVLMIPEREEEELKRWIPQVIDFAFARLTEDAEKGIEGLQSLRSLPKDHGKPRYMTPDLVQGYPRDQQWEVEAFAWIACELLTGEIPARGNIRELLERKVVSKEMVEKLVAATKPREQRYANMVEFVENPFSRCADELLADVINELGFDNPTNEIVRYLCDPYIQKRLIKKTSLEQQKNIEQKKKALNHLKKVIKLLKDEHEACKLYIDVFCEYLEDSDENGVVEAIRVLKMNLLSFSMIPNQSDIQEMYERARKRLFKSRGKYEEGWMDCQRSYFQTSYSEQPSFNHEPLQGEEKKFFLGLVETAVLDEKQAAHVLSTNIHTFSAEELHQLNGKIVRMAKKGPEMVCSSLLEIIETASQVLQDKEAKPENDLHEALAKNRIAQECLLEYARSTQKDPKYRFANQMEIFPAILESVRDDSWYPATREEITALCQNRGERDADALLQHSSAQGEQRSRSQRIKALFYQDDHETKERYQQRLARIPGSVRIDWLLEYWESNPDVFKNPKKKKQEYQGAGGRNPLMDHFGQIPSTDFTEGHVARMRKLVFLYSEREAAKKQAFGNASPQSLELRGDVIRKLIKIEFNDESKTQEAAEKALSEIFEELRERIEDLWFIDWESQTRLLDTLRECLSSYEHDSIAQQSQTRKKILKCQESLNRQVFFWFANIIPAWIWYLLKQQGPAIGIPQD